MNCAIIGGMPKKKSAHATHEAQKKQAIRMREKAAGMKKQAKAMRESAEDVQQAAAGTAREAAER